MSRSTRRTVVSSCRCCRTSGRWGTLPCALRSPSSTTNAGGGMIAVEEAPSVSSSRGEGNARRRGVVSQGLRVYLRALSPDDLEYLSAWAEDPFIERMVGSEFLNSYKHVYDKDPSFYEACLMDSTQIVLVIEASTEWADRRSTRLNSSHGYISYAV